jgi:hypothetical protein
MRFFAIVLNGLLFTYSLFMIYSASFPNQPKDILLQFLLLVTPAFSLSALLFRPPRKTEKFML